MEASTIGINDLHFLFLNYVPWKFFIYIFVIYRWQLQIEKLQSITSTGMFSST